jgi:hypothetical protein
MRKTDYFKENKMNQFNEPLSVHKNEFNVTDGLCDKDGKNIDDYPEEYIRGLKYQNTVMSKALEDIQIRASDYDGYEDVAGLKHLIDCLVVIAESKMPEKLVDNNGSPICALCLSNTREVADLKNQNKKLVEALKLSAGMINHIACVQGCDNGTIRDTDGDPAQCQWCDEKNRIEQALAENKEAGKTL